ncbi:hypothetical protein C4K04_3803 [Pseudomonas chlororaphis]|uniref:Uncharacterized protein n=1 Tax=Pseudomonas chlororaphis TaxID=587753 RepID=A0A3G7TQT6_9PSED|nr:hypothetical protein C4K04_3803 [Pseudomonas chlororaphis]
MSRGKGGYVSSLADIRLSFFPGLLSFWHFYPFSDSGKMLSIMCVR